MALGFGLVIASMILSWIAGIVFGGFKIGSLERVIEVAVVPAELQAFFQRMTGRLAEIGFRDGEKEGEFLQSGVNQLDLSSFTHAKTSKKLMVQMEQGAQQAKLRLSLRYLDPIVGDTGESAYRDSVLDYVMGKTDVMLVVRNRSFAAASSLVGAVVGVLAAIVFWYMHVDPRAYAIAIGVFSGTNLVTGVLGLVAVLRNRSQLSGIWEASAGITVSALLLAVVLGLNMFAV